MFLLPLLILAMAGFAIYMAFHRRPQPAKGIADETPVVPVRQVAFWPTTVAGEIGLGAFVISFLPVLLVNVIQVPFLGPVALLAALVLTGYARFAKNDRSSSVLVAFSVSALAAVAGLLFLAGEVFIGHD